MTNLMLYGSLGATGAPLEATLVMISGSSSAIVGVLATLATVGLLLVGMVAQRYRATHSRTTSTLTVDPTPWCRTPMTRSTLSFWVVLVAVCGRVATTHAAAVLIPDHTFILGSCGGPQGDPCDLSPPVPLTLPARVVAVRENGPACWEATYSAAKLNAAEGFQAISD